MITLSRLRDLFDYSQETGEFRYLQNRGGARAGKRAGYLNHDGYIQFEIDGKKYAAHRLAWFYVFGRWPADQIDHINGKRHDNRIANLREANVSENQQNLKKARVNNKTSGLLGVTWHKGIGKWQAQIKIGGRNHYLGVFETAESAYDAYLRAKRALHPFGEITSDPLAA